MSTSYDAHLTYGFKLNPKDHKEIISMICEDENFYLNDKIKMEFAGAEYNQYVIIYVANSIIRDNVYSDKGIDMEKLNYTKDEKEKWNKLLFDWIEEKKLDLKNCKPKLFLSWSTS